MVSAQHFINEAPGVQLETLKVISRIAYSAELEAILLLLITAKGPLKPAFFPSFRAAWTIGQSLFRLSMSALERNSLMWRV